MSLHILFFLALCGSRLLFFPIHRKRYCVTEYFVVRVLLLYISLLYNMVAKHQLP